MAYQSPLNGGRINASIGGNSTSAGAGYSLISTGTMLLAGGNNITLSQNGSAITFSGASQSAQTQSNIQGVIAGASTNRTGNISFANSNGITFGLSNNTITASVAPSAGGVALFDGANSISSGTARVSVSGALTASINGQTLNLSAPVVSSLSATGAVSISNNAGTISIGAPAFSAGMSNIGNTSGTSATASNRIIFAGGNNITLSQSTGVGGNTLSIIGAAGGGGGGVALFDGANSISSGTARVSAVGALTASVNGQTLNFSAPAQSSLSATGIVSISRNASTISIGAPAFSVGISSNTAGTAGSATNQIVFAGGNNITLSQSTGVGGNTVSIIGAAGGGGGGGGTLSMYALGNTTQNSSATIDARSVSFNGIGGLTAGYSNGSIQLSAPILSNIIATGALSISNSSNSLSIGVPAFSVGTAASAVVTNRVIFSAGDNITLSQSTNSNGATINISGGGGGGGGAAPVGSYFDNMIQQNSNQALTYTSVSFAMFNRVIIQPLSPANELFPYNISAATVLLDFSNGGNSTQSASFSSIWHIGLYSRVNSTQLSLINSASTGYAMSANAANSASLAGARWLSFHSSQFSTPPNLNAGSRYFFAFLAQSGVNSYGSMSMGGMHLGASAQRSGYMNAPVSSNTSYNAWHPFMGVYSVTTQTALPSTIANSQINKASSYANFIPHVIFDAGLGQMG